MFKCQHWHTVLAVSLFSGHFHLSTRFPSTHCCPLSLLVVTGLSSCTKKVQKWQPYSTLFMVTGPPPFHEEVEKYPTHYCRGSDKAFPLGQELKYSNDELTWVTEPCGLQGQDPNLISRIFVCQKECQIFMVNQGSAGGLNYCNSHNYH